MNTNLVDQFKCAITRELSRKSVITSCDHIFDVDALLTWLERDRRCPVCREQIAPGSYNFVNFVQRIINELIDAEEPSAPPQPRGSSNALFLWKGDDDMVIETPTGARIINVAEELFNPSSCNARYVYALDNYNRRFIHRFCDDGFKQYMYIPVYKYVYTTTEKSALSVAKELAQKGVFVYDIFQHKFNAGNTTYIVYSPPIMVDGTPNILCRLRNQFNTQT